jgi:ribonuclease P protein subunit POP4
MANVDPIFKHLRGAQPSSSAVTNLTTLALLETAFPQAGTAQQIYAQKLEHRPLSINPTTLNSRESRRQKRLENLRRKRKPRPLSAKEKRDLKVHEVSKEDIRYTPGLCCSFFSYSNFTVLNKLWNQYVSEILPSSPQGLSTAVHGATLLKADYHGAYVTVEDCRCLSRIGICGICIKETKNLFELVTTENRLVRIPKEMSLFRVTSVVADGEHERRVEWRLWGDQFLTRSGERAGKKFTGRTIRGKALLEL